MQYGVWVSEKCICTLGNYSFFFNLHVSLVVEQAEESEDPINSDQPDEVYVDRERPAAPAAKSRQSLQASRTVSLE